jgi:hypothetical protein
MAHDYASIDDLAADYDFFGEAQGLMDMEVLKGHGIAALGGAGGALVTDAIFGMESVQTYFADKPGYAALARFLFGIAGGRAIYHFEGDEQHKGHPAAYGFVGQVAGSAAAGGAMMLYTQYGPADETAPETDTAVPTETGHAGLGRYSRRRGRGRGRLGSTGVEPVAPYYDRYKVSVPRGTNGLSGEEVTRSNYFQVNGLGDDGMPSGDADGYDVNEDTRGQSQPGWPAENETPDVGSWIG